jgi:NAD(P)-dependent dehydrogenase (short-subunit alcohol dehydrogenase family)
MEKTIVVTGASGNLGTACVDRLVKDNYKIIATTSERHKGPSELPKGVDVYPVDLTNEASALNFVKEVTKKYPVIDGVLLLVGGFAPNGIAETTEDLLNKMLRMNFYSAFFMAKGFLPILKKQQHGKIIFIASKTGVEPWEGKGAAAYTLSKAILLPFAQMINEEGKADNVTAVVIAPGTIDTELNRKYMPDSDFSKWTKPEAIAEAISFLLSEKAKPLKDVVFKMYA